MGCTNSHGKDAVQEKKYEPQQNDAQKKAVRYADSRPDAPRPATTVSRPARDLGNRPEPPPPDCSADELIAYLNTYKLPTTAAVPEHASDDDEVVPARQYHKGRRKTFSDAVTKEDENYEVKVVPKSSREIEQISHILARIPLFSHLDDRELALVVQAMERGRYAKAAVVIEEGEMSDEDRLYIIISGQVAVMKHDHRDIVRTHGRFEYFGELELLHVQPRIYTVNVSSEKLETWELRRIDYRSLLRNASTRKRKLYTDALRKIDFLKPLSKNEITQLADCLQPVKFADGDLIIAYGEEGEWMYIILEGTVRVMGRKDGREVHACDFGAGDHVGELEFINHHKTVADVYAVGEVRCAKLNRYHFELCMGPIKDLLKSNAESNVKYKYYQGVQAGARTR